MIICRPDAAYIIPRLGHQVLLDGLQGLSYTAQMSLVSVKLSIVVAIPRQLPPVAAPHAFAIVTVPDDVSHITALRTPDSRIGL